MEKTKKVPTIAIAPEGRFNSFEGGSEFKIISYNQKDKCFSFISPLTGNTLTCSFKECAHIEFKNWKFK